MVEANDLHESSRRASQKRWVYDNIFPKHKVKKMVSQFQNHIIQLWGHCSRKGNEPNFLWHRAMHLVPQRGLFLSKESYTSLERNLEKMRQPVCKILYRVYSMEK